MKRKLILFVLSIFISSECILLVDNDVVKAETDQNQSDQLQTTTVASFVPLSKSILFQQKKVGDTLSQVQLPRTLAAFNNKQEPITIAVASWKCDKTFNSQHLGTYVFTPVLDSTIILAENVELPVIRVSIASASTSISGLRTSIKAIAGKNLTSTFKIYPAYSRTIYLQKYDSQLKKWINKKTIKTRNVNTDTVSFTFPSDWYQLNIANTTWRLYAPASKNAKSYTKNITIQAQRAYQNPRNYYQIKTQITLPSTAGYTLRYGYMGLKVTMVQQRLGMGRCRAFYGVETQSRVRNFQKSRRLKVTGIVDLTTWKKLGFTTSDWYYKGAYVSPIKVNLGSTKNDHIEAMISNARRYLGTRYVIGASGKPGTGIDCSGLVMQSMYAAGIDPYPISPLRHSRPGYEYESANMWKSSKLKNVPYSQSKRGDLIFYADKYGNVIHVAIYLGGNRVIESWPGKVVEWPIKNGHRSIIKGVMRIFV